jgi:uncharacterized heparinase superfamily protein
MFNLRSKYFYFLAIKIELIKYFKKLYFTTNFYNKSLISKIPNQFYFFPNPLLLFTFVNYKNFSLKIPNTDINFFWDKTNNKDNLAINSFLWLSLIDRKNDVTIIQKIIKDWIAKNNKYKIKIWDNENISQRIISWILNADIILKNTDKIFKELFFQSIIVQINHLKKNIRFENNKIKKLEIISAVLLSGLVFKEYKENLEIGMNELQKLIADYYDEDGAPKNRNINDLITSAKYLILIKECCKDAQEYIPDYLDDILEKNINCLFAFKIISGINPLFNGATENKMHELFLFINNLKYKKKKKHTRVADLEIIKNKKTLIYIDVGAPPKKDYSEAYQSGPLSMELFYNNEKIITNCGYGKQISKKAELLSRLTSAQSTLTLNDSSVVKFEKNKFINKAFGISIKDSFKISEINKEENDLFINFSAIHNAYEARFGYLFKRCLKINKKDDNIIGQDTLIKIKENVEKSYYNIRFHLYPGISAVKTIGGNSILIQINKNSSLIFVSKSENLFLEKSIFMGRNQIVNNFCINISGNIKNENKIINWEIKKNI